MECDCIDCDELNIGIIVECGPVICGVCYNKGVLSV